MFMWILNLSVLETMGCCILLYTKDISIIYQKQSGHKSYNFKVFYSSISEKQNPEINILGSQT